MKVMKSNGLTILMNNLMDKGILELITLEKEG